MSATEPGAFAVLYRRHAEDLLRYFARRTLDPEAAAELTAETFAQAFASRTSYRDTGANGVAWICESRGTSWVGSSARAGSTVMPVAGSACPNASSPADYERIEDLVDFAPIRDAIEDALETLREDQREALRLRVIEELPYTEVARRLACSEENARQRVSRGLRRLALMLQERGLQPAMESEP